MPKKFLKAGQPEPIIDPDFGIEAHVARDEVGKIYVTLKPGMGEKMRLRIISGNRFGM